MVFRSLWLAAAACGSAELCQRPQPGRRRLRADEVLHVLFRVPAQQLERLALCLFTFFCLPLPEYYALGSGRGGWSLRPRPPSTFFYTYRRSLSSSSSSSSSSLFSEAHYYSD